MNYKSLLKSKKFKIAVWGTGYIGLSTLFYFAKKKIKCVGYDINKDKIKKINSGTLPLEDLKKWFGFDIKGLVKQNYLKATSNYKNLICEILSLNNYLELDKKFISFEINTPDDILLNDQIKIIFNSDYDINIFLYNLAEDKYLRVVKKIPDLELINVTRNEFLSCEFESLSLISSDLLICKELLLKLFSKTELSNFAQLTENIYTLPTSYFLNKFNNKEDFIGRIKLLDIDILSKKNFKCTQFSSNEISRNPFNLKKVIFHICNKSET